MIELSLANVAVLAIGGSMVLMVLLVLKERQRIARRERRALRDRVVCRLCLAVFEAGSRDPVQVCPDCGGLTNREGAKPLG